jgi:hypothetical protein
MNYQHQLSNAPTGSAIHILDMEHIIVNLDLDFPAVTLFCYIYC